MVILYVYLCIYFCLTRCCLNAVDVVGGKLAHLSRDPDLRLFLARGGNVTALPAASASQMAAPISNAKRQTRELQGMSVHMGLCGPLNDRRSSFCKLLARLCHVFFAGSRQYYACELAKCVRSDVVDLFLAHTEKNDW